MDLEQRLTELEMRFTYQERLIEELNEVLTHQARELERLVHRLERLETCLESCMQGSTTPLPSEEPPPPHY
ncbi:MAG: SlyX family protein [Zetaproteobacteria bacterium]|nr:MAG: SlyX family protein [Zetaproteobacteria bacterium]